MITFKKGGPPMRNNMIELVGNAHSLDSRC